MKTTFRIPAKNLANIRKWVKALESGKYRKITDSLRGDLRGQFCALGVGMKVFEKETGTPLTEREWDHGNGILPKRVMEWFGLGERNPKVCVDVKDLHVCRRVTELNDKGVYVRKVDGFHAITFKTIAAGIRKTFNIK